MARDLYDSRDAVNADATLSDKQRRVELLAIDEAYRTLSNQASRDAYDRRFLKSDEPGVAHALISAILSPGVLAFAFLCLMGATVYYYNFNAEQARLQIEKERIVAESERFNKELEAREQREAQRLQQLAENRRVQQEQAVRTQFERDRRDLATWQRNTSYEFYQSQREYERAAYRARREEERAEDRYRELQEERRLQALQDLERQKRFLRELERR
jgi:hypothetical protein